MASAPSASAVAASPSPAEKRIYQQRGPDGRIVLTDRPDPSAVTQRTWQAKPEDEAAARQRREAARLDAVAVGERVQKQLDSEKQRDLEASLARQRQAEAKAAADQQAAAEARAAAERARIEAAAQPIGIYDPNYGWGYGPRPGYRPGWPPVTTPGVRPGFPQRPPRGEDPPPVKPPFIKPPPGLPSRDPS